MTHRWGKRINPAAVATLLDEAAIHKMLTPLHTRPHRADQAAARPLHPPTEGES